VDSLTPALARLIAMICVIGFVAACHRSPPHQTLPPGLPLRDVGEIALPGDNSRFGGASLDAQRGWLFIAHQGENEVIEVDVDAQRVVRTIPNLAAVHGVLAVPELSRVYATATRVNQVVAIDENTGAELGRAPTGDYPDGLAYDSHRSAIWISNERAGTETVVDAATLASRGTVDVGGQAGNVAYDAHGDRILVAVQTRNDLAVIDPATMTVIRRVALPECDHPHGLAIDESAQLAFVACDNNATLVTVDQTSWRDVGAEPVGQGPDGLAYDSGQARLYVAAESGILAVLLLQDHNVAVIRSAHFADDAHVVALDSRTHRTYYPAPGSNGPVLLIREAT
jgi:DNA-binding beta-propeller fold protein YncE